MLARRPANPLLRRRLRPPQAATDQQDNKKNIMFHRVRTQARCAAVAVLALVAAVLVSACATRWQDKLKIEAEQHLQQGEFSPRRAMWRQSTNGFRMMPRRSGRC